MTLNRFIVLLILLSILAALFYHLQQWRLGKLKVLSSPTHIVFPAAISTPNEKTRIVLFGDSRMAEWQSTWPAKYDVVNRGISGSTSVQALERLKRDVLDHDPDWVVVQVGINDIVASRLVFGKAREKILDEIPANLEKILNELTRSGARVILMPVVPDINIDMIRFLLWQGSLESSVKKVNAQLQTVDGLNVITLDTAALFATEGKWRKDFSRDALHWNTKAYEALQTAVLEIIERRY